MCTLCRCVRTLCVGGGCHACKQCVHVAGGRGGAVDGVVPRRAAHNTHRQQPRDAQKLVLALHKVNLPRVKTRRVTLQRYSRKISLVGPIRQEYLNFEIKWEYSRTMKSVIYMYVTVRRSRALIQDEDAVFVHNEGIMTTYIIMDEDTIIAHSVYSMNTLLKTCMLCLSTVKTLCIAYWGWGHCVCHENFMNTLLRMRTLCLSACRCSSLSTSRWSRVLLATGPTSATTRTATQ